ncbi:MAG TPA: glycosyltransferase [Solirubrobacteraceae bacterium]
MFPKVSVVVPAYNLGRYLGRAIDSALAQDWSAEALEVIVVDDGSTDETPQVLAAYGDRIRAIRQDNGGLVRAVDRGLAEVTGDYVALLDADDEWPGDRLSGHVAHLEAHPEVGLVHGDMTIIDADGAVLSPSFFEAHGTQLTRGRVLGRLLGGNFVSGGASTFRASLLPAVHPIADDAAYPDWWIAATIAAVAEIDHVPGCANLYRYHGANMGLGSGAQDMHRILGKEIPWRRWMLRHLVHDPTVSAADLRAAYSSWEYGLVTAALGAGLAPSDVVTATAQERERSVEAAAAGAGALRAGDPDRAARLLLNAIGEDPWNGAARLDLEIALQQAASLPAPGAAPPLVTGARVTLAAAVDLVAAPDLLAAYARATPAGDDATLVVVYDGVDEMYGLATLVAQLGLEDDGSPDIVAVPTPATQPARRLLVARATAALGAPALAVAA